MSIAPGWIQDQAKGTLDAGLTQEQPTFMNVIKQFKKECKIGGVRVVVKYTHNGNPILTRIFQ